MSHNLKYKGFSLIELLVSLGIMSVILGVVINNQQSYTETASLVNLADSISIAVSQAQAYGIAVRETSPGSSVFTSGYGITLSILSNGSNSAYLFFADKNGNGRYDGDWSCPVGGAFECLEKVSFQKGNYIDSFCVLRTDGSDICNDVSRSDIVFVRPEPEARLKFFNPGGNEFNPANIKGAKVILKSANGLTKSIIVYSTGQISVQ